MQELTLKIQDWAIERNLHDADPNKQILKLGEEFGEVCEAMAKGYPDALEDGIGDMFVVLTILAMQNGTSIERCVARSYNEIKDRKGVMKNGVFVKEADLE